MMSGTAAVGIAASTGNPGVLPQLTGDDRGSSSVELDHCEGENVQQGYKYGMDDIEKSQKNMFGENLACGQVADFTLGGGTGIGAFEHANEDLTPPSTERGNRLSTAVEGQVTPPYETLRHVPDPSYDVGNCDEPGGEGGRQSDEQGIGESDDSPSPLRLAFLHCVGSPYDRDADYDENDIINGGVHENDEDSGDDETGGMGSLREHTFQLLHSKPSSSRIMPSAASARETSRPKTALDIMMENRFSAVHGRPPDFSGDGVPENATRIPTFSGGTYIFRADGAMPTDVTMTPYLRPSSCPSGIRGPVMITPPPLRLSSTAEEESLGLEPTSYDPTGQAGLNLDFNRVFERSLGTRLAGATWNTGCEGYGTAPTTEAAPPSRLSKLRTNSVECRESLGRVADVADSTFPPWGSLDSHSCWGRGFYANVGMRDDTGVGDEDVGAWRAVGNLSRDAAAKSSRIALSRPALASARSRLDGQATVNLGGVGALSATGGMSSLDIKVAAEANRPPPSASYHREEKCASFDLGVDSFFASTFDYDNLPGGGSAKAAVGEVTRSVASVGVNNAFGDTPSPLPHFQFESGAGPASLVGNDATRWNKPAASPFGLYRPHDSGRWASFAHFELGETISAPGEIIPTYPVPERESAPTGRDDSGSCQEEGNCGGTTTGGGNIIEGGRGGGDMSQWDASNDSDGIGVVGSEVKEAGTSLVAAWRISQVNADVHMNVVTEHGETPEEQDVVSAHVLSNGSGLMTGVQEHNEPCRVAAVAARLTCEPPRVPGVSGARDPSLAEGVAHGSTTYEMPAESVRRTQADALELNWEEPLGLDILFPDDDEIATAGAADSATVGVGEADVCAEVGGAVRETFVSRDAAVLDTSTPVPIRSTGGGATASSAANSARRTQAEAVGLNWEGAFGLDILFPDNDEISTAGAADGATVGAGEVDVCAEAGGAVREVLCSRCGAILGTGTTAAIRPPAGDATRSSTVAATGSAPDAEKEDISTYGATAPSASAIAASPTVFSWFGRVCSTVARSTLQSSGLLGWASKAVTPMGASGSGAIMTGNKYAKGRKRLGAGWQTAPGVIPYRRDPGGPEEWGVRGMGGASHCANFLPL